jgi:hypothetical protein
VTGCLLARLRKIFVVLSRRLGEDGPKLKCRCDFPDRHEEPREPQRMWQAACKANVRASAAVRDKHTRTIIGVRRLGKEGDQDEGL